jgi:hypothetical protein
MRKPWLVLVLSITQACSSGNGSNGGQSPRPDGGSGHPDGGSSLTSASTFEGQWSCPYTTNSGFQDSTKMVFTRNSDGTLSSTSKIQDDDCALKWTVSGSIATAAAPQTCGSFTVTSYTFKLEQGVAFASATAIEHGTNVNSDGTTTPIDISGSFDGFCTKDGTPDAGTPTVCERDPNVGCGANNTGYRCLGVDSPQSMSSAITCPQLFLDGSSCCTLGSAASTCQKDSSVACTGSRSGYTCSGADTPAQAAAVVCEPGKTQGDHTTYCCGTYTAPSCTLFTSASGCGDYTFSCMGTARPFDSDSSLRCGPGSETTSGATLFCCSVRDPAAPSTCTADPTINCSPTMGYSCTGTDTPSDDDPTLVCGTATMYQGMSLYCCRM